MKSIMIVLFTVFMGITPILSGEPSAKKAADFSLPTLKGDTFQLKDALGKGPVLINFWASWCGPCLREMKKIKPIYSKYKDRGFQVISISIDDQKTAAQVPGIVKSRRIPYIILMDMDQEVKRLYQVKNPPFSVLLNSAGEIIYQHEGYRNGDEKKLEEALLKLLEPKK